LLKDQPIFIPPREDFLDKGLFVECTVGCRVYVNAKEHGVLSKSLHTIHPFWVDRFSEWWFLTKDQTLMRCRSLEEINLVRRNKGILYLPEGKVTQLVMRLDLDFDVAKDIARNPKKYKVDVVLAELEFWQTRKWGHFLHSAMIEKDFDTEEILRLYENSTGAGREEVPSYFPVEIAQRPWLVTARLISASLKDQDGLELASFKRKADISPAVRSDDSDFPITLAQIEKELGRPTNKEDTSLHYPDGLDIYLIAEERLQTMITSDRAGIAMASRLFKSKLFTKEESNVLIEFLKNRGTEKTIGRFTITTKESVIFNGFFVEIVLAKMANKKK
jgi:hypothetical protein